MCLLAGLGSAGFLNQPRTASPGNDVTHSGLGPHLSLNNENNPSQSCSRANFIQGIPRLKLFLQVTLGCVALPIKAPKDIYLAHIH